jgi:hypothetical protein
MRPYRGFVVWGIGIVLLLTTFLIFVLVGWPGVPNSCIFDRPNSCYCEAFNQADVVSGMGGKRGGSSKGGRLNEETESGNNAWRKHQFGR